MHVLAGVHRVKSSFQDGLPLMVMIIGTGATVAWNVFLIYLAVKLVRRFV